MDDSPILICYDDSSSAKHAIDAAGHLFAGRRAIVLDVAPPLTGAESLAELGPVIPDFQEINTADALANARLGTTRAREDGLVAEPRADLAAPTWEGVIEVADEIDAAAIVIGSRGLNGAEALFRGSLSHDVAEHAGRPVLIVPPAHHETRPH